MSTRRMKLRIPTRLRGPAALALIAAVAGCQDLHVVNLNNPDRGRALANKGDVESLIATSWTEYWGSTNGSTSTNHLTRNIPLSGWGSEGTGTFANWEFLAFIGQPRIAFDNAPTSAMTETARFHWQALYSGLSSANEGLAMIAQGLSLDDDDSHGPMTIRAQAFAKFVQGLMHGYIGLLFDRGWIFTEEDALDIEGYLDSDRSEFVPYTEVLEQAIRSMKEAIAIAEANSFTLPGWIWNANLTNEDLVKLAYSFMARFRVYGARTPAERAALDWNEVMRYVENGITEDFAIDVTDFSTSGYRYYALRTASFSMWADYLLIGPADISGSYQAWLQTPLWERTPFDIVTPDRRITGVDEEGAPDPLAEGKYFTHTSNLGLLSSNPERGPYLISNYRFWRWRSGKPASDDSYYRRAPLTVMTVDEMNLILAEAHLRLGNVDRAVELVNRTRVANGELPPATAAGVSGPDCVPRMRDGSCADLLNTLMYERMIEGALLESSRTWLDSRGFGRLIEGTPLHLPVPGRELENLMMEYYTFGGIGGEWTSTYAGGEAHLH